MLVEDLLDHGKRRAVEPRGLVGDVPIVPPRARISIGIGNGHDLVRLKADGDDDAGSDVRATPPLPGTELLTDAEVCQLHHVADTANVVRLSGRPHVQPGRDEPFDGRSNRGLDGTRKPTGRADDTEQNCIMALAMQEEPIAENTFTDSTSLFGNTLTRAVVNGGHNFKA